ncbi:hypothetical protein Tco_0798905 [Tanacetum coccineum]
MAPGRRPTVNQNPPVNRSTNRNNVDINSGIDTQMLNQLIATRVAEALAAATVTHAVSTQEDNNLGSNFSHNKTCNYKEFRAVMHENFRGTEGAVGLTRCGIDTQMLNQLIATRVAEALAAAAVTHAASTQERDKLGSNSSQNKICNYKEFRAVMHENFRGTEGVVGLTRWFEKLESQFGISNVAEGDRVKFASSTLLDGALTWWNVYVCLLLSIPLMPLLGAISWGYFIRKTLQETRVWNNGVKAVEIKLRPQQNPRTIKGKIKGNLMIRPTLGLLVLPSVSLFSPTIRSTARISILPIEPNIAERAKISAINLDDYQFDPLTPLPSPSSPFSMAAYQQMIAETEPTQREEVLTAYGTGNGQNSVHIPETALTVCTTRLIGQLHTILEDMDRYPNACLEELEAFMTLWDVKPRVEESSLETLSVDELITQLRQMCEDAEDRASNAQEEARQKRKEALEEVIQRIYRNNN